MSDEPERCGLVLFAGSIGEVGPALFSAIAIAFCIAVLAAAGVIGFVGIIAALNRDRKSAVLFGIISSAAAPLAILLSLVLALCLGPRRPDTGVDLRCLGIGLFDLCMGAGAMLMAYLIPKKP